MTIFAFECRDINCTIRDITLRGLDYRPQCEPAQLTLIALHGWLDNAASFDLIAPKLAERGLRIIAIDLAGQGMSDMRPLQGSYHLWDDAVDVMLLAQHLELSHFALLGHSRGAMIAAQMAAAFPEVVSHLAVLDGLLPIPVEMDATVTQFKHFVSGFQQRKPSRLFASRAEALQVRAKAARMESAAVELLAKRGLFEHTETTHDAQIAA